MAGCCVAEVFLAIRLWSIALVFWLDVSSLTICIGDVLCSWG